MKRNTLVCLKNRALEDPMASNASLGSGLINALLGAQNVILTNRQMASNMTEPRMLIHKLNIFFV